MNPRNGGGNPIRLLLHVPVPWVYVLSYFIGVGIERVWPSRNFLAIVLSIGAVSGFVFAMGVGIAGWGWLIFRMRRTTTVPGRESSTLVTWGPYRFTRNPMYVGLALAYLGEAGMWRQAWPIAVLPFTLAYVNCFVIPLEEARLHEVFGEGYEQYRERVRRWI
ncbi:MAG TPA: isoprenylcysteine carboxylmethyltransferase family protein [Verrucomicrobiae bacterium]|jgi:protein-S-isoprenylcysteine O-methyltransferase Ste14